MQTSLRVLLADDHELVRAGTTALLEAMGGVSVVGDARNSQQLLVLLRHHEVDLVICDVAMPGLDGISVVPHIRALRPQIRILMLSMHDSIEYVRRAVAAGANGYLRKCCGPDELEFAIRRVMYTGSYFGSDVSHKLLEEALPLPDGELTDRQKQVLTMLAQGLSAKEIGYRLKLSPKTVDRHRARVMGRLRLADVAGLTRYAMRVGLVSA